MYVIARHQGEEILILDGLIEVKVLSVTGNIVRLGFNAPREISIERKEIAEQGEVPSNEQD